MRRPRGCYVCGPRAVCGHSGKIAGWTLPAAFKDPAEAARVVIPGNVNTLASGWLPNGYRGQREYGAPCRFSRKMRAGRQLPLFEDFRA